MLFIGTANVLDAISPPLRGRMEIIELTGYTEEEKLQIAKRHLLVAAVARERPQRRSGRGLRRGIAPASSSTIPAKRGVRSLERQIGALMRNAAVSSPQAMRSAVAIGADDVTHHLGRAAFRERRGTAHQHPGRSHGSRLRRRQAGDILFIESSRVKGTGKLILTGQLGDVMKESAQAAVTLVKSQADRLKLDPLGLDNSDLHIHVPAGAIPKDGPSAGVAIATSLASLLSQRTVRADVTMTGEISLRGVVMPVGGIKEKCVAAARAGIRTVILPARNRRDLEDIPESVRAKLEFVWAEKLDDVLARALEEAPVHRAAA